MSLDRLINILVTATLIEMMVPVGLRVTFAEIVNTARSWPLIAAGCGGVTVQAVGLLVTAGAS